MLGPIAAAWLMDTGGRNALFYYSAAGAVLLAGFTFWRMRVRAPAAVEGKTVFVPMSPRTPAPVQPEPRTAAAAGAEQTVAADGVPAPAVQDPRCGGTGPTGPLGRPPP